MYVVFFGVLLSADSQAPDTLPLGFEYVFGKSTFIAISESLLIPVEGAEHINIGSLDRDDYETGQSWPRYLNNLLENEGLYAEDGPSWFVSEAR